MGRRRLVGVQGGHAPPGGVVPGRSGQQVPGVGVIEESEPVDLAGRAGVAVQRGVRHGDGDQRTDAGTAVARNSSARAASSSDSTLVTSSMILTWTGSRLPAASAAKVTGSRRATVRAYSMSPAADIQDGRNAAATSSAAKSCRRGRDANSASAAIRAHASRDSERARGGTGAGGLRRSL